ncbi:MAG: S26 family signal peptidase [Nanoarchaeota archaeon]
MNKIKRFWGFLKKDTWQSWLVSLILIIAIIKLVIFPGLSFITGSSLPLVVIESCSMYHSSGFDSWWNSNGIWYEEKNISKENFKEFSFKNGLNKGDIILVRGDKSPEPGEVIIFSANPNSDAKYPIIHRAISLSPLQTKGDHNNNQLTGDNNRQNVDETLIESEQVIGKAVARLPLIGWIKLVFFESGKDPEQRGFCK